MFRPYLHIFSNLRTADRVSCDLHSTEARHCHLHTPHNNPNSAKILSVPDRNSDIRIVKRYLFLNHKVPTLTTTGWFRPCTHALFPVPRIYFHKLCTPFPFLFLHSLFQQRTPCFSNYIVSLSPVLFYRLFIFKIYFLPYNDFGFFRHLT